jgi:hypothetical protein
MRKSLRKAMSWTRDEELRQNPPDKPFSCHLPTISQRLWPKQDNYLRSRALDPDLARKNFWFPSRTVDGYDRVVVPATSDQTGNLYWQARLLSTEEPFVRRWESPHGVARGNAVCLVWPRLLTGKSLIVEGPMDALAAAGEGFLAVALMGVTPAPEVLDLTSRLIRGTICAIVMDLGAETPMAENAQYLAQRHSLHARLITPYPAKDLAAMTREERRALLGVENAK